MGKIGEYYKKKELLDKLTNEIKVLEQSQDLKREFEFEEAVKTLLSTHKKTAKEVLAVLRTLDSSIGGTAKGTGEKRTRAMKTYKNPNTGEVVKTKGGNHKTLNAWREKHGKEAVNSWLQK